MALDEQLERLMKKIPKIEKAFAMKVNRENFHIELKKFMTPPLKRLIRWFYDTLDNIIPDQYDIQIRFRVDTKTKMNTDLQFTSKFDGYKVAGIYIIIKFPEVVIKNSHDSTLTLKDLFVRQSVTFSPYGKGFRPDFHKIVGTRSTVSLEEFVSQYMHSHLPRNKFNTETTLQYSNFCTGSSELEASRAMLNSEGKSAEYLELYIQTIYNYVGWESLEGGPHIRMSTVAAKAAVGQGIIERFYLSEVYNQVIAHMKKEGLNSVFDWVYKNNKWNIVDNNRLETFLAEFSKAASDIFLTYPDGQRYDVKPFFFKDEKGEYYSELSKSGNSPEELSKIWTPYKNQKIFFTVDGKLQKSANKQLYIHPKLKDHVRNRFEELINKCYTRKAAISRLNSGNTYYRHPEQDQISL